MFDLSEVIVDIRECSRQRNRKAKAEHALSLWFSGKPYMCESQFMTSGPLLDWRYERAAEAWIRAKMHDLISAEMQRRRDWRANNAAIYEEVDRTRRTALIENPARGKYEYAKEHIEKAKAMLKMNYEIPEIVSATGLKKSTVYGLRHTVRLGGP
jgi:hypothetical protein